MRALSFHPPPCLLFPDDAGIIQYAAAPALGIVVAKPTQRSLMYCSEVCAAPALHRDALRHPRANQPHFDGRPALPYTRAALDAPLGGAFLHTKRARAGMCTITAHFLPRITLTYLCPNH
ncbi:hypothetical protein DFH09DRAFT_1338383 [Mycena vulgaris]|nr:hypothetical protein DFH09DRAFT_1338383 [Mycena vulgaris]